MLSLTGKRWRLFEADPIRLLHLKQTHDISEAVARVALRRGISAENFEYYSAPTLVSLMPDPFHLLDMDKAVERCVRAICNGETIGIIGDYDVDGATSSALLHRFFAYYGLPPVTFIPDRIRDGYGPCPAAYEFFAKAGVSLCVTVDCGASAIDAVDYGNRLGIQTIVTDHHIGGGELPKALAVVNPNRADETSSHGYLAGVGVAFLLAVGIRKHLRDKATGVSGEPDLRMLLDLVALGTICDVAPLVLANRAFVKQGLKIMALRKNKGMAALADVSDIRTPLSVYHLGFQLGPRINAGGRVGDSDLGYRLLVTEDSEEAMGLASKLNIYNEERKALEARVTEEACVQAAEQYAEGASILMARGEDWHPGVIGIVAGRVKEKFYRPCAVMSVDESYVKASLRSIDGVDIGTAIIAAKQEGLLVAGGGHAMAAGFTAEKHKLPALTTFLHERLKDAVDANAMPVVHLDAPLALSAVNERLVVDLEKCSPYGAGNASPRFLFTHAILTKTEPVGTGHLRCFFKDAAGSGRSLKAMCFRAAETPLGEALMRSAGQTLAVAGTVTMNYWQGNATPEMRPEDVALQSDISEALAGNAKKGASSIVG